MARRFNTTQRSALWLAADGKCQQCGDELPDDFHADHIVPHSKGGATDVINGQALCPTCNLRKGVSMPPTPRDWQRLALDDYCEQDRRDYLLEGWPGCGKTNWALMVAAYLLSAHRVSRVVVVTNNNHNKKQWRDAALRFGLEFTTEWMADRVRREGADYVGMCITYHAVACNPEVFRAHLRVPTLVIFDEIHHAGTDNRWGDSLRHAFGEATHRLALSGTPFRSDNKQIPFVRYENGLSVPDYPYTYANALSDGVCPPVYFPSFDGRMRWASDGDVHEAVFDDTLNDVQASERLRTAIDAKGGWFKEVFAKADAQLTELRKTVPGAAGLILARKIDHAESIADAIEDMGHPRPALAHDDSPDASGAIRAFRDGSSRWFISVRMVSEGVDIPRLSVLIYATNVAESELFFRQAVGRIMRGRDAAYFYFPKDERLVTFAERIMEIRDHHISEDLKEAQQELADWIEQEQPEQKFFPLASSGEASDIIAGGAVYLPEEFAEAGRLMEELGGADKWPDRRMVVEMMRRMRVGTLTNTTDTSEPVESVEDRCKKARLRERALINRIVIATNGYGGRTLAHKEVSKALGETNGFIGKTQPTLEHRLSRLQTLEGWLANGFPQPTS